MELQMIDQKEREAGRQLDAEIAERVMGATWTDAPPGYTESQWLQFPERGRGGMPVLAYRYTNEGRERVYKVSLALYSSDIAAAFQVVEVMRAKGSALCLDSYHGRWRAEFSCGFSLQAAYRDTPALAICLAALKAIDALTPAEAAVPHPPSLSNV